MDWPIYGPTFRERMDEAQDAARLRVERSAYLAVRIVRKRLRRTVTVLEASMLLGVSTARVKMLCGQGRIIGAKRARKGRGSPWIIPEPVTIREGRRGPQLTKADAVVIERKENAPF